MRTRWEDGGPERLLGPELPLVLRDRAPRVTVVGDPILDGWWRGRSERMSREAPAPVVEVVERKHVPGGAANTAVNLAALGAQVSMVGVAGDDESGHLLRSLLEAAGVDVSGLVLAPGVRTTTKVRIVGGEQILVRLDEGTDVVPPAAVRDRAVRSAAAVLSRSDAVVVCDYGSGPSPALLEILQQERPPLLVVDAHDLAPWAVVAPDLVTPNAREAFGLLDRTPPQTARVDAVHAAAEQLVARTGAAQVVVTLDAEGAVLLDASGPLHRTTADPVLDKQAAGAGDTFVAALTLARAGGVDLPAALELAQAAADVVVHRSGTSVCTTDDLADHLGRTSERVLPAAELALRVQAERAAGRRVVLTNGCFDVLHRGHTTSLAQAARLGDLLVVAVNSDDSVRRLKGPQRPINTDADRAGVLAALSCVDYVTVFETDTPIPLLELLQPDVYAKGGDYTPEMLAETEVVRSYGGEVKILEFVPDHSTTDVVTRIRSMVTEG
jgi:D-beta-D-heptose 7-phosphate kinase / D-beta-D-heptose 1-phosphate adenosyltransferase